ncbi:promotilin [Lemur catta]|uniref:promotilin n=1 Tax=Lemur catta TaxID=9447 RepID=UPI001E26BB6C|nr:promotilin [Lemur catta]
MVSHKAVAALLVVHAAAMLASQTEAFVPIFTYGELQRMQERERNKGHKKSLSVWQRSEEPGPAGPMEPTEEEGNKVIKLTAPVEIGMRMNSRQLEKYRAALEGLLREELLSTQNGARRAGVSPWPTRVCTLINQEQLQFPGKCCQDVHETTFPHHQQGVPISGAGEFPEILGIMSRNRDPATAYICMRSAPALV